MAKNTKKVVKDADPERGELTNVAIVHDKTIINGHVLPAGCVVGLYGDEIEAHRNRGVPLDDVADGDDREVFDVQTPFEAKDGADDEKQAE